MSIGRLFQPSNYTPFARTPSKHSIQTYTDYFFTSMQKCFCSLPKERRVSLIFEVKVSYVRKLNDPPSKQIWKKCQYILCLAQHALLHYLEHLRYYITGIHRRLQSSAVTMVSTLCSSNDTQSKGDIPHGDISTKLLLNVWITATQQNANDPATTAIFYNHKV